MKKIIAIVLPILILTVFGVFIYTLADMYNRLVVQAPGNVKTEKQNTQLSK